MPQARGYHIHARGAGLAAAAGERYPQVDAVDVLAHEGPILMPARLVYRQQGFAQHPLFYREAGGLAKVVGAQRFQAEALVKLQQALGHAGCFRAHGGPGVAVKSAGAAQFTAGHFLAQDVGWIEIAIVLAPGVSACRDDPVNQLPQYRMQGRRDQVADDNRAVGLYAVTQAGGGEGGGGQLGQAVAECRAVPLSRLSGGVLRCRRRALPAADPLTQSLCVLHLRTPARGDKIWLWGVHEDSPVQGVRSVSVGYI